MPSYDPWSSGTVIEWESEVNSSPVNFCEEKITSRFKADIRYIVTKIKEKTSYYSKLKRIPVIMFLMGLLKKKSHWDICPW